MANDIIDDPSRSAVRFGQFSLDPARQLLLEGGRPVIVGARSLAILIALVERAGEVVSNQSLVALVWPDTFVEDSNLRVHVGRLRRSLRDGQDGRRYLVNIPGRGYKFVAAVTRGHRGTDSSHAGSQSEPIDNLPPSPSDVFGREPVIEAVCIHLRQSRFVTLVGPGGIGKTTVALSVARRIAPSYQDGVRFADLASISNPQLLPTLLSAALGLAVPSGDTLLAVTTYLRHKQTLLVLDSCEHIIEAATIAGEEISRVAPGVDILATSREPLRAGGERIRRLQPLEGPSASVDLTAAQAMKFPSIQLLVERATEMLHDFILTDADAQVAADICRRLDGIPLAIVLAAGRLPAFGLRGLSERLDDRFALLTGGRRTAHPRHQTLLATLDWSHDLLSEDGRKLLRLLAAFAGDFTLDAAAALLEIPDQKRVAAEIADLVEKSLVTVDPGGDPLRYRLLDTTRRYGLEKLRQANEIEYACRAHAAHFSNFFASAAADCETLPQQTWFAKYASQLDNLRAALEWSRSRDGEADLFVALTVAAVPVWVHLSLVSECREQVEHALELLLLKKSMDGETSVARSRMQLSAARGWSLMYDLGRSDDISDTWAASLELAERLGDTNFRPRAAWGVWASKVIQGDFGTALKLAQRLNELVSNSTDVLDLMMADRLLATTLHYRGDQNGARRCSDRMLRRAAAVGRQPRVARFQGDQRVTAHYFRARILWLQGFSDQAKCLAESNVNEGLALGHALTLGDVLGQGTCVVSLLNGDAVAARHFGAMLLDHTEKHGLRRWRDWARCFDGLVSIKQGDVGNGLSVMAAVFDKVGSERFQPRYTPLLGEFAASLGLAGELDRGLETIDGVLAACDRSEGCWYVPELLRSKGELLILKGAAAAAEVCFERSIQLARHQGAQSWELRSALSLGLLRRKQNRGGEAQALVSQIFRSFSEGFETADLRAATEFL